jgi:hypothetical protein
MPITHTPVESVPPDGESLIGTDGWNAAHIIPDGTITAAMLASGAAAQSLPLPLVTFDFSDIGSLPPDWERGGVIFRTPFYGPSLNGRHALALPTATANLFAGDCVDPIDSPIVFIACRIDELASLCGLSGVANSDYSTIGTWDDSSTVRWGGYFWFDTGSGLAYVFRPTAAPVDTDLHVYAMDHGVGNPGIFIDGVLWPWTDSEPAGWVGRPVIYPAFDLHLGYGDNVIVGGSEFAMAGAYGEVRIYPAGADIVTISEGLLTKWQGNVVPLFAPRYELLSVRPQRALILSAPYDPSAVPPQDEVWTVALANADDGTFGLTISPAFGSGVTVNGLAWNALEAAIQGRFDEVLGGGQVVIAGNADSFTVTLQGTFSNQHVTLTRGSVWTLTNSSAPPSPSLVLTEFQVGGNASTEGPIGQMFEDAATPALWMKTTRPDNGYTQLAFVP